MQKKWRSFEAGATEGQRRQIWPSGIMLGDQAKLPGKGLLRSSSITEHTVAVFDLYLSCTGEGDGPTSVHIVRPSGSVSY
jgi:hypothetical protein